MKEYIVTFSVCGEVHSLQFTDNINSDRAREANAKIWIDISDNQYRTNKKIIIVIKDRQKYFLPIFNDIIIYIELSDNRQHNKNKSHVKQVNGGDKQPEKEPENKKAYD